MLFKDYSLEAPGLLGPFMNHQTPSRCLTFELKGEPLEVAQGRLLMGISFGRIFGISKELTPNSSYCWESTKRLLEFRI